MGLESGVETKSRQNRDKIETKSRQAFGNCRDLRFASDEFESLNQDYVETNRDPQA